MLTPVNYLDIQKSLIDSSRLEDIHRDVQDLKLLTSQVPVLARQDPNGLAKAYQGLNTSGAAKGPKSAFFDPLSLQYALGYKDRRFALTYETLKRIANQVGIVSAIINTRIAQIASFSQPYRQSKSLGFVIKHKSPDHLTTDDEREFIKILEAFILDCGEPGRQNPFTRVKRPKFESFIKMIVRDTLTYDQIGFEVIPRNNKIPFEFRAVDAATLRLASPDRDAGMQFSYHHRNNISGGNAPTRFHNMYEGQIYGQDASLVNPVQYVQVINGQIENIYTEDELAFGIRNPRSDIYIQGYGYGELEQLITIITGILYAEEYNRVFFCVSGDLAVITDQGLQRIEDCHIMNSQQEKEMKMAVGCSTRLIVPHGKIWTGTKWSPYRSYKTSEHALAKTKLKTGFTIETSTEHWFKAIPINSSSGLPEWIQQKYLKPGDRLLMNSKVLDFDAADTSFHMEGVGQWGKSFSIKDAGPDLWETLGWWLGDGSIGRGSNDFVVWHYRRNSEEQIAEKHRKILLKYGLNPKEFTTQLNAICKVSGQSGPRLRVSQNTFVSYLEYLGLIELGTTNKQVPSIIFSESVENRCAFLKGYFSADGCVPKRGNNPVLSLKSKRKKLWVSQIQQLLLTLGIRSIWQEEQGHLVVSDSDKYIHLIGFVQEHKTKRLNVSRKLKFVGERLHPALCQRIAKHIMNSVNYASLSTSDKKMVQANSVGRERMSGGKFRDILFQVGVHTYDEILSYYQIEVKEVEVTDRVIPMYDIEVFDDEHQFIGDGVVVHNTQGAHPKGILNFRGDNWTPDQLECVAEDSLIQTDRGTFSIGDAFNLQNDKDVRFKFWNGQSYELGTISQSGIKPLINLGFDDGTHLRATDNHRVFVLTDTGEEERFVADLQIGDLLLQNETTTGQKEFVLKDLINTSFKGISQGEGRDFAIEDIGEDLWEVLGWFTRDGWLSRDLKTLLLFYHHEKDASVFEQHGPILEKYGIAHKKKPNESITWQICHKAFAQFLIELGFEAGKNTKIPWVVFAQTPSKRIAFLKGLFSANGFVSQHGYSVGLASMHEGVISGTQSLLNTVGISSYRVKHSNPEAKQLFIRRRELFKEIIGFNQQYKMDSIAPIKEKARTPSDPVPLTLLRNILEPYRSLFEQEGNSTSLGKAGLSVINKQKSARILSRIYWREFLESQNNTEAAALLGYRPVRVSSIDPDSTEMTYDVTIDQGAAPRFVVNGVLTHNSFKRQWVAQVAGTANAWKTPITQSEGIEWIDLQRTNQEMEFGRWLEYLIKITCFTPETEVVMGDGSLKPISEIKPNEFVLTHMGNIQSVNNVQEKPYDGEIICLQAGQATIRTTPEHPFLVASSWRENAGAPKQFDDLDWKLAGDITMDDYLVIPKPKHAENPVERIDLANYLDPEEFEIEDDQVRLGTSNRGKWIRRFIDLTEENAFVLGLYVAEGCTGDNGILRFSFEESEEEYRVAVADFAERHWMNSSLNPQPDNKTISTVICSKPLAKAFDGLFGKGSHEKKIPDELISATPEAQKAFISGLIAGDGSVDRRRTERIRLATSSVFLKNQFEHILLMNGIYPQTDSSIRKSGYNPGDLRFSVEILGPSARKMSEWLSGPKGDKIREITKSSKIIRRRIYDFPGYFFLPVREIWREEYKGSVFNLEVNEDNSYTVNHLGVHNCGVYLMDPSEINFDLHGGVQQTPLFESSQEWKLKASRDRGLKPLLRFIARLINEYVIDKIDDHFVFEFAGLDELTEQEKHELLKEQISSYMTLNEARRQLDLPDIEGGIGDLPLNANLIQLLQMQQSQVQQQKQMEQQQQQIDQQQQGAPSQGGQQPPAQGAPPPDALQQGSLQQPEEQSPPQGASPQESWQAPPDLTTSPQASAQRGELPPPGAEAAPSLPGPAQPEAQRPSIETPSADTRKQYAALFGKSNAIPFDTWLERMRRKDV